MEWGVGASQQKTKYTPPNMEWGVGALQQKTRCTPPITRYNLPNKPLDIKILLMEPMFWVISKII
jgi:hypothetical protein